MATSSQVARQTCSATPGPVAHPAISQHIHGGKCTVRPIAGGDRHRELTLCRVACFFKRVAVDEPPTGKTELTGLLPDPFQYLHGRADKTYCHARVRTLDTTERCVLFSRLTNAHLRRTKRSSGGLNSLNWRRLSAVSESRPSALANLLVHAVFTKREPHLFGTLRHGTCHRRAIQLTYCLTRDACRHTHQRHNHLAAVQIHCQGGEGVLTAQQCAHDRLLIRFGAAQQRPPHHEVSHKVGRQAHDGHQQLLSDPVLQLHGAVLDGALQDKMATRVPGHGEDMAEHLFSKSLGRSFHRQSATCNRARQGVQGEIHNATLDSQECCITFPTTRRQLHHQPRTCRAEI